MAMSSSPKDPFLIDSHKMHYHMERVLQSQSDPLHTFPIYVEVSPVGHCNHRCTFCAVDYIGYKARSIETQVLKNTLVNMKHHGVKSVMFAGEGEPLLHKSIADVTFFAGAIGLDVAFTTNGVLLDKLLPVLDAVKWVKVSLNAGDEETYEKIHQAKKGDWQKVWANIGEAVDRAQISDKEQKTVIGVQTVVLPDNLHTIDGLIERAKEAKVDYVVLKPYSQHKSSETRVYEEVQYNDSELLSFAAKGNDRTKVIVRTQAMEDWDAKEHSYKTCGATPFFWAYIMATGDVYSCSAYLLNDEFRLGNVNEQTFKEIWEGEKRRAHIEKMKTLDISQCRLNCRMNQVNKYLAKIATPNEHANFI